jgi:putative flippase GtrA
LFKKFKNLKIFKSNNSWVELFRTYLVGAFNLVFGLSISYLFQFYILIFIPFPLRTYLTNIFGFSIGVVISYFISRKIIFQLSTFGGTFKEFVNFTFINLINLFGPLFLWFLINLINEKLQTDELWFLIITILINGVILPIKYLLYKFFVFKDSL